MTKSTITFLGVECSYAEGALSYFGYVHGTHRFRVSIEPNGSCKVRVTGDGYEIRAEGSSLSKCEDEIRVEIRRTTAAILDLADVERVYSLVQRPLPTCKECGWPFGDMTHPAYAGCYPDLCTCPPEKRPSSIESSKTRTPTFEVIQSGDHVTIAFAEGEWDYRKDVDGLFNQHVQPIMARYLHQQGTRNVLDSLTGEIQNLLLHLMDIGEIRRSGIGGKYSLESGFFARRRAEGWVPADY
jgi:hypothetical protein